MGHASDRHGGLLGESAAFLEMLEHASRAAELNKPVLVIGERGSGKELVAERLHFLSQRWDGPLVRLNCATLNESLLETELFGHESGAFTGANRQHPGRFERADGGTLFLDELATISQRMQEQLLRAVEYGEFERVGGSETLRADVRVVAATNADLPAMARDGRFRPDLLDRLAFDVIQVPPLRQRRQDILPLAEHFAIGIIQELGRPFFPGFSEQAAQRLTGHDWPGNIRELKNAVERSVYRESDPEAPIGDIALNPFTDSLHQAGPSPATAANTERNTPDKPGENSRQSPGLPDGIPGDLDAALAELEQHWLKQALEGSNFRQTEAAKCLGLSYDQLRTRLRKYDLRP